MFDNYLYNYNDLATFNSDGSGSVSVNNSGSGGGGSAWAGSGGSSYFEDYNTSPWHAITDDSHVYDVSGWASYGYSYNDSLLSTIAADGTTTTAGFIHDEGTADGESILYEHTCESFEEWVTDLDSSSHTYDETDTDITTIATQDEDIDRTISFFSDGTTSTIDNSTSNSGSTTTETVLAAGFWSVTFQGATTSGSYGTPTHPTGAAYLLASGSSATSGSATTFANRTDSSAALGLAVQQSGLPVSTSTGQAGNPLSGIAAFDLAERLSALGIAQRPAGEPDMDNALAWFEPPGRAGTFDGENFGRPAYELVERPNFGSLTIGPETREFAIANPALFNDYFTKYGEAGIAKLDALFRAGWTINLQGNSWDFFGLGYYYDVDGAEKVLQLHGGMSLSDQVEQLKKAVSDSAAKVPKSTTLSRADQATITGDRSDVAFQQAKACENRVFSETKQEVIFAGVGIFVFRAARGVSAAIDATGFDALKVKAALERAQQRIAGLRFKGADQAITSAKGIGSRFCGAARANSDLDIAIFRNRNLSGNDLANINRKLDEIIADFATDTGGMKLHLIRD